MLCRFKGKLGDIYRKPHALIKFKNDNVKNFFTSQYLTFQYNDTKYDKDNGLKYNVIEDELYILKPSLTNKKNNNFFNKSISKLNLHSLPTTELDYSQAIFNLIQPDDNYLNLFASTSLDIENAKTVGITLREGYRIVSMASSPKYTLIMTKYYGKQPPSYAGFQEDGGTENIGVVFYLYDIKEDNFIKDGDNPKEYTYTVGSKSDNRDFLTIDKCNTLNYYYEDDNYYYYYLSGNAKVGSDQDNRYIISIEKSNKELILNKKEFNRVIEKTDSDRYYYGYSNYNENTGYKEYVCSNNGLQYLYQTSLNVWNIGTKTDTPTVRDWYSIRYGSNTLDCVKKIKLKNSSTKEFYCFRAQNPIGELGCVLGYCPTSDPKFIIINKIQDLKNYDSNFDYSFYTGLLGIDYNQSWGLNSIPDFQANIVQLSQNYYFLSLRTKSENFLYYAIFSSDDTFAQSGNSILLHKMDLYSEEIMRQQEWSTKTSELQSSKMDIFTQKKSINVKDQYYGIEYYQHQYCHFMFGGFTINSKNEPVITFNSYYGPSVISNGTNIINFVPYIPITIGWSGYKNIQLDGMKTYTKEEQGSN